MSFPLGSFTDGLFSGAQNTIQLMGEVQKYQENSATFEDRAKAYRDAVAGNQPQGTQATQPSTALPSAPVPKVDTPVDPNATPLSPAGSPQVPATPTVIAPPAAAPTPAPTPIVPQTSGNYDLPPSAPAPAAPPAQPPAAAPGKTSALGGTAYTNAGQTQTADASSGKSYTSDAPLVYLPPGQFSAQVRGEASQVQTGQRPPPSQVTALAGNFPTVGRA